MLSKFPKTFEGSISLMRLSNQNSVYSHSHDFLELVYVEDGSARHTINGIEGQIKKGNYFVVDYDTQHRYSSQNRDLTIINCLFSPEILDASFAGIHNFNDLVDRYFFRITGRKIIGPTANQIFSDDGKIGIIMEKMLNEYETREEGYLEMLRCMLSEIIISMVRIIGSERNMSLITEEIIRNVEKDCINSFSLKKLCKKMNYSLPYVSAKFKKESGITVTEFLRNKRIEKACQYLAETDFSISNIAEMVGYSDIKFFNKIFKKVTKTTPKEYRKQNR